MNDSILNTKVSFIIPVYNGEITILETVQSILNQSYKNLEAIVVSDGSTDNSVNILKNIKDERLQVYEQKNRGACSARNLGFSKSKGSFIQFFDADDLIPVDFVEEKLKTFSSSNDHTIVTNKIFRFKLDPENKILVPSIFFKSFNPGIEVIYEMARQWKYSQVSGWMITRCLYEKVNGWNESLKRNQDGEIFFRLSILSDEIKFCDKTYSLYRETEDSLSSKPTFSSLNSFLNSIDLYKESLLKYSNEKKSKKAIASFYSNLMYLTVDTHSELYTKANMKIKLLDEKPKFGNLQLLNFISKIIGFRATALLTKKLKKFV